MDETYYPDITSYDDMAADRVDEMVADGSAAYSPDQIRNMAKLRAAQAAVSSWEGMPDGKRQSALDKIRTQYQRVRAGAISVPPSQRPLPPSAQAAQHYAQLPNGMVMERTPTGWVPSKAGNQFYQDRVQRNAPQFGQDAGDAQQYFQQTTMPIAGTNTIIHFKPDGTPVPIHVQPNQQEMHAQSAREKSDAKKKADFEKAYLSHYKMQQSDIKQQMADQGPMYKGPTEPDQRASEDYARSVMSAANHHLNPMNAKYEDYLREKYGSMSDGDLSSWRAQISDPADAQHIDNYLKLKKYDNNESGGSHVEAPDGWSPKTKQQDDPNVLALIQKSTPANLNWWHQHSQEEIMSPQELKKELPNVDYDTYSKMRSYVKNNAAHIPAIYQKLRNMEPIQTAPVAPPASRPNTVAPRMVVGLGEAQAVAAHAAKKQGVDIGEIPMPDFGADEESAMKYLNSLPSQSRVILPNGKKIITK